MTVDLNPTTSESSNTAVERMIEFSRTHSIKLPAGETVEELVREMRLSQ